MYLYIMRQNIDSMSNILITEMNEKLTHDNTINPVKLSINKCPIDNLLIYTTIGNDKKYLKLLETFCESLCYTNLTAKSLLVICDKSFHSEVNDICLKYAFLTYHLMDVQDTLTPEEASGNKLRIFEFNDIFKYSKCIYVDLDCCFLNNLDYLFTKETDPTKLHVFTEFDDSNILFASPYFVCYNKETKQYLLTPQQRKYIVESKKKAFNAGLFLFSINDTMKHYFSHLQSIVSTHEKNYYSYFEQSFMNAYFNINNAVDYTLFTYDNVIMRVTPSKVINNDKKLIHYNFFTGTDGSGKAKSEAIEFFWNQFSSLYKYSHLQFETRQDMIRALIPPNGTLVEVGVFEGVFSESLLGLRPRHLYLVDPWVENQKVGSGDVDGNNYKEYANMGELYTAVKHKYEYNPHVSIIRKMSHEFLTKLKDNSIDAIYLDGDHSYESVKNDLELSWPKVKRFGWIMGHDYEMNMKKAKTAYNFGVKRAVDEFCEKHNLRIFAKGLDGCVSYAILKC